MDFFAAATTWICKVTATWHAAAIIGGVLIMLMDRWACRAEPSDADARRTAERYRLHYGERALAVISDHLLAASFVSDSGYRRFLERVSAELSAAAIIGDEAA